MKTSFKDLIIEYIFSMLGFFAGLYIALFVLSMVGLKGYSEPLWFLIGVIVGAVGGLLVMIRSESGNNDARMAYHKALDEGRGEQESRFGTLLKNMRPLTDPLSAMAASLLVLIPRGALEQSFPVALVTTPFVALLVICLRVPAMFFARKKWAKEHIKK